jgi:hypothetical protein
MNRRLDATRAQVILILQSSLANPSFNTLSGGVVISNCTGRWVFCCITMARLATCAPWQTSCTRKATRSHLRGLLSKPRLNSASSSMRCCICRRTRIDQMSFGFGGAFWSIISPLFHAPQPEHLLNPRSSWISSKRGGSSTTLPTTSRPSLAQRHRHFCAIACSRSLHAESGSPV